MERENLKDELDAAMDIGYAMQMLVCDMAGNYGDSFAEAGRRSRGEFMGKAARLIARLDSCDAETIARLLIENHVMIENDPRARRIGPDHPSWQEPHEGEERVTLFRLLAKAGFSGRDIDELAERAAAMAPKMKIWLKLSRAMADTCRSDCGMERHGYPDPPMTLGSPEWRRERGDGLGKAVINILSELSSKEEREEALEEAFVAHGGEELGGYRCLAMDEDIDKFRSELSELRKDAISCAIDAMSEDARDAFKCYPEAADELVPHELKKVDEMSALEVLEAAGLDAARILKGAEQLPNRPPSRD